MVVDISVPLNQDYAVTVLNSFIFNQPSLLDCCADPNFESIQADICDFECELNQMVEIGDGSPGGGFLLFVVPPDLRYHVAGVLAGFPIIDLSVAESGTKIIFNA